MDVAILKKLIDPETRTALEALCPGLSEADPGRFLAAVDLLAVDVIKMLVAEAVQKANSGHPGGPMSCADFAHVLHTRFLKASDDPAWLDRDRFILSGGHMSTLLYTLLHFQGRISLDELKTFRQFGTRTQGHPVYGLCPGVETSTGPLGQGFSNGVGMALAEAYLRSVYGPEVVDHRTYVLATDGDIQEGVCREAAALAAHLELARLTVFYDANAIQLSSPTAKTMSEDVARAFSAYGWHVLELPDGHDHVALAGAIRAAQCQQARPTMVIGHTVIAQGTSKAGSGETHGAPLGQPVIDEFKSRKKHPRTAFWVPPVVHELYAARLRQGNAEQASWNERFARFEKAGPELAAAFRLAHGQVAPDEVAARIREVAAKLPVKAAPAATRVTGGEALAGLRDVAPHLFGGSADLANSTKTDLFEKAVGYYPEALEHGHHKGRAIYYGVREHAMGAITNGLAVHGGILPFAGTFLAFSDYMRGAIRLAAISKLPSIFVFTHDSFFVGEDGESHQPIEQLEALRLVPRLVVLRPADAHEATAAWAWAVIQAMGPERRPVCLILTRQNLPILPGTSTKAWDGVARGAYVIHDTSPPGRPHLQVIATGSEVHVAVAAAKLLAEKHGKHARVISMPSMELFRQQSAEYRDSVLLPSVAARLGVEAGTPLGWKEWTGDLGEEHGLARFGESAPAEKLADEYGFTPEKLAGRMLRQIHEFPARWAAKVRREVAALADLTDAELGPEARELLGALKR